MPTALRVATSRTRDRARMWGETWALTGEAGPGWPVRYLDDYGVGEGNAGDGNLR